MPKLPNFEPPQL